MKDKLDASDVKYLMLRLHDEFDKKLISVLGQLEGSVPYSKEELALIISAVVSGFVDTIVNCLIPSKTAEIKLSKDSVIVPNSVMKEEQPAPEKPEKWEGL